MEQIHNTDQSERQEGVTCWTAVLDWLVLVGSVAPQRTDCAANGSQLSTVPACIYQQHFVRGSLHFVKKDRACPSTSPQIPCLRPVLSAPSRRSKEQKIERINCCTQFSLTQAGKISRERKFWFWQNLCSSIRRVFRVISSNQKLARSFSITSICHVA